MKTLSIIIPVYNEEKTIKQVIREVLKVRLPNLTKEIIVVNDGSTDKTFEIIKNIGENTKLKIYNLPLNLGKGAAVRLGLLKASGEFIIIQDADLELNPREYPKILIPLLDKQARAVYGSRFLSLTNKISLKARVGNAVLTKFTNMLFSGHLSDMETAYKAFESNVLLGIRLKALEFEFEPEITARILQKGINIHEVSIKYNPRSFSEGKKIRFKDAVEAIFTLVRCRFW